MDSFITDIKSVYERVGSGGAKTERDYDFFTLLDKETKTYRFITGFDYMTIFKCGGCDLDNYEVPQSQFLEARQNGSPMQCPVCGKVLDDSDIKATRPRALKYDRLHGFVPANGSKRTFVCKGPGCPICAVKNAKDGKQTYPPKQKLIMYAVEVEKKRGDVQMVGGVPRQSIESIEPVLDDNGNLKIVQFERPIAFFHILFDTFLESARCDHYAFDITRSGNGNDTRYAMARVPAEASAFDYTLYGARLEKIMAETEKMYTSLGSDDYYKKSGWGDNDSQAVTNTPQPVAQPTAFPTNGVPQAPAGVVSWAEASAQLGAHNNGTALEQYL